MSVYLSEYIDPKALALLKDEGIQLVDNFDNPKEIEGIMLRVFKVNAELMDRLPNLKVIAKHGAGYDSIDIAAAKERGIYVTYTPTANSQSVAELIVTLAASALRNVYRANVNVRKGTYNKIAPAELVGHEITGKTVGLIGCGNIATRAANIFVGGYGTKVIAFDPFLSAEQITAKGFEKVEDIKELVRRSDIVNVSVQLNDSTRNLISGDIFDCFKPTAVLINAARGGIVNEDDLYNALAEGKLYAAACDAFEQEPPKPETCRLLELDNFLASPHIGGSTEESLERTGFETVQEVIRVLKGQTPHFPIC